MMDFTARELKFGFKDKDRFDAEAVKKALQAQRFANADLLSGPCLTSL
jgi:hypothetical protein